jgi:hypothetical protein
MFKTEIAAVVAAVALTACAFDEGTDPGEVTESLEHRLGTRETLTLQPDSLIGVTAVDQDGTELPCLEPDVAGGDVVLRSTEDGLLLVEKLDVQLTDVTVEPGVIYDAPIHLTDIELRLGTMLVLQPPWAADRAEASGTADLIMDWALLDDDGDHLPMATQRLRDAQFAVDVRLDDSGRITAEVRTGVEGHLAGYAGKVELTDFSMAVNAATPVEP